MADFSKQILGWLTSLGGSSGASVALVVTPLTRRTIPPPPLEPEALCRPACSRSRSVHKRIDESKESISNRFGSARGVVRKESKMFVTSRRSTLVSDELRRRRRRASVRCSFMITAGESQASILVFARNKQTSTHSRVGACQSAGSSP